MTQEWMIKTLISFGFGQRDSEVYVFLALNGVQKASAIAEAIKTQERQVYRVLEKLEKRKIVSRTENLKTHFVALPFDRLLDLLVNKNLKEAQQIEQRKDDLLALWGSWDRKEQER